MGCLCLVGPAGGILVVWNGVKISIGKSRVGNKEGLKSMASAYIGFFIGILV